MSAYDEELFDLTYRRLTPLEKVALIDKSWANIPNYVRYEMLMKLDDESQPPNLTEPSSVDPENQR